MFLLAIQQMPPTALAPRYSLTRYWRYVFVPLVVVLILVAWYTIFTLSPAQLSIGALPKLDVNTVLPAAAVSFAPVAVAETAAAAVKTA
jgi:hypothetical protein